jgi:hypothetical protein
MNLSRALIRNIYLKIRGIHCCPAHYEECAGQRKPHLWRDEEKTQAYKAYMHAQSRQGDRNRTSVQLLTPLRASSSTRDIQDFLEKAQKHYQSSSPHCRILTAPIGFDDSWKKRNISNIDDTSALVTFSCWTRQGKWDGVTVQLAFLCTPPPYVGRTSKAWSLEQWHAWGAAIVQHNRQQRVLVVWDSNAEAAYLLAAPTRGAEISSKKLLGIQRALIKHVKRSIQVKEAYIQGSRNDGGGQGMLLTGNWLENILARRIVYPTDEKEWEADKLGFIRKLKW